MKLSKTQLEAVNCKETFIAITAGAGSGKTRVLVERVARLIDSKEATMDDILAITFTEKAALELKERLTKTVDDEIAISTASIGTFHSFCAKIIRDDAPLLEIDPDFGILEEQTAGLLLRKAVKETLLSLLEDNNKNAWLLIEELDFRGAVDLIEELIDYRWHSEKTIGHRPEAGDQEEVERESRLREAAMFCFAAANKVYAGFKGVTNLDFSDLEIFAIRLLENRDVQKRYQKRFKHILVDEFQDINDTQSYMISLLFKDGANRLTIVGDEKQSIYRFRGANVNEFKKALGRAKKKIVLKENFRSSPSIIGFVNDMLPHFEPLTFPKDKELGTLVETLPITSDEDARSDDRRENEAKELARIIPSLKGETALLFNSLKSSQIYTKALNEAGISHIVAGGSAFLEKEEVVDIINALRVTIDKNDVLALLGIARSPYIGLTDEELFLLCRTGDKEMPLYDKISKHPKSSFLITMDEISCSLSISELIRAYAKDGMTDDLEKLCHIANDVGMKEKISLKDFIEYLKDLKKKEGGIPEFPKGAGDLLLMTIHQAKGLEFDNVILCDTIRQRRKDSKKWCFIRGVDGGLAFKLTPEDNPVGDRIETPEYKMLSERNDAEDKDERERLLYVAMTRAKTRLIIPLHKGAKKDGDWHKLFIEKCAH